MKKLFEKPTYNSMLKPICIFNCNDNINKYSKEINVENYVIPCDKNYDEILTFLVYDYIKSENISNFININNIVKNKNNIVNSVILQYILCVFDLGLNKKIVHLDLNSGNALIRKTNNKKKYLS